MHCKQPVHKLALILVAVLFVFPSCMVNSSNNKDDQSQNKDTDVYVQMSIRSKKKKGKYRWDTVIKAKGFDPADMPVPMPLSFRSDSGGGSSPDTVDVKISVGKYTPSKRDKDDDE